MKNNYVSNLSEYITEIASLTSSIEAGQLLFRGHNNRKYKAEPSVFRKKEWSDREHEMLRQLLAEHPREFSQDVSTFELLARAQHYGLPTRLLDVTSNPLIALYFACKEESNDKAPNKRRSAGEVLVFSPENVRKKFFDSEIVSCLSNLTYLSTETKSKIREHLLASREFSEANNLDSGSVEEIERVFVTEFNKNKEVKELIRLVKKDNQSTGDKIHPDDITYIVAVLPRKLDERIIAQSGAFLVFGLFSPESEPDPNFRHFLQRLMPKEIYISPKHKNGILNELNGIGIHEESLFPSLEKTANKIKRSRI